MKKAPINADLIIFDLDGTLIDSRDDIVDAVNATLVHLGLKKKGRKFISSFIGWGSNSLLEGVLGKVNRELMKKAIDFYWWYYRRHGLDNTGLFPGAKDVLRHFRDKKMVIISNKAKAFVVGQLRDLGVRKYFKKVIGGDDLKCSKPSPCPVLELLKRYKIKKQNAIIVGDMALDIETGKNAGIYTCGVTYGIGDVGELKKMRPDFVISRLSKLKEIIT